MAKTLIVQKEKELAVLMEKNIKSSIERFASDYNFKVKEVAEVVILELADAYNIKRVQSF